MGARIRRGDGDQPWVWTSPMGVRASLGAKTAVGMGISPGKEDHPLAFSEIFIFSEARCRKCTSCGYTRQSCWPSPLCNMVTLLGPLSCL